MNKKVIYTFSALPYRQKIPVYGYYFGGKEKTVAVVGSMRGDEYQQMCVCAMLVKRLKALEEQCFIKADSGIVVIPSASQFSMNVGRRFFPVDNTDINRMFPGYNLGETTQRLADSIFSTVKDYQYGIQLASYYLCGDFVPHVRAIESGFQDHSVADDFGLSYMVVRQPQPIDTTTLNYNWQVFNTTAFSVYSGSTSLVDINQANASVDAIIRFLIKRGVISEEAAVSDGVPTVHVGEGEMKKVQTQNAGLLHKMIKPGDRVNKGQVLGIIIDPYEAEVLEEILSPCDGVLFFSRTAEAIAQHELVFTVREE